MKSISLYTAQEYSRKTRKWNTRQVEVDVQLEGSRKMRIVEKMGQGNVNKI